jgi:hypothetical protein
MYSTVILLFMPVNKGLRRNLFPMFVTVYQSQSIQISEYSASEGSSDNRTTTDENWGKVLRDATRLICHTAVYRLFE